MVVQGDGHLDQALEKFAIWLGRGAPDIFENFVRFKELSGIEELDAWAQIFGLHDISVA